MRCRAAASAPPVRAIAVDHTVEAVVEPALSAEDMKERRERRAAWNAQVRCHEPHNL